MNENELNNVIDELDSIEQEIFMKIIKAEKEILHKKMLQGTSIKKDIVNLIKEGVK